MVRVMIAHQLKSLGFEHHMAASASEAAQHCRVNCCSLVLIDREIPAHGNSEVIELIRSGQDSPLTIILTGSGDRHRYLHAGIDDYLQKPFLIGDLEKMIKKWLP